VGHGIPTWWLNATAIDADGGGYRSLNYYALQQSKFRIALNGICTVDDYLIFFFYCSVSSISGGGGGMVF